jgi:hypothetical protein
MKINKTEKISLFFFSAAYFSTLKMEAVGSSEALVNTKLHAVTPQETLIFIVTTTRTSHLVSPSVQIIPKCQILGADIVQSAEMG